MELRQSQCPAHDIDLFDKEVNRPQRWVVDMGGIAAAQLIIEDHLPPGGRHRFERFQILMGHAWPAVQTK